MGLADDSPGGTYAVLWEQSMRSKAWREIPGKLLPAEPEELSKNFLEEPGMQKGVPEKGDSVGPSVMVRLANPPLEAEDEGWAGARTDGPSLPSLTPGEAGAPPWTVRSPRET